MKENSDSSEVHWRSRAGCVEEDTELFYATDDYTIKQAIRVCLHCSVREACLSEALENGEKFGVWGGMSERDRGVLLRRSAMGRSGLRGAV